MKGLTSILTVLFFVAFSIYSHAQDYAVSTRGDTVRGSVKFFDYGSEKKVQVVGSDNKKVNIPLLQTRSVFFENETYHPVKGPSGYVYMKLLKSGYLSLYAFRFPNQATFDGLFLVKKDGDVMEVPNLNFKRAMKKFMAGCHSTVAKIEDGSFSRRDIPLIVDHFNACISSQTSTPVTPAPAEAEVPSIEIINTSAWITLSQKVAALNAFESKADALEMIAEIQKKITRSEKVPNFMIEGLKNSLRDKGVDAELDAALQEIK
jgi:hypothetical protein